MDGYNDYYTTVKPASGNYVQTTLEAVNATGVLKAVVDNAQTGHVAVTPSTYPLETATMNSWVESRPNANENPHPLTTTLKSISTRVRQK